jgi:hypothetical protein
VASAVSVLLLASGCENTADPLAPEAGGATGAGGAMSAYGDRYTDPDRTRQREETYLRMNDERGYPRDPY